MINRYNYKDLVWVDVQSPTQDEVRALMDEFSIHPLVADELLGPTLRPKVDLYPDFIYLILRFPTLTHKHDGKEDQEIDFIVGKKFIITAHYDLVDQLHEIAKVFEVNTILNKSNLGDHAGFILYYILKELYKSLDGELEHINHSFNEIQAKIFSGRERDMVGSISHLNRDLLNFKQTLRPHKEVLESFEIAGSKFFGQDFSFYLHTIVGEFYKIASILEGHRETALDLRDTNDSLLTTKTNDTMKLLTVMSFTFLPLSFIASLFGMNAIGMPIVSMPNAFWIIFAGMGVIGLFLLIFFKFRKWL
ncbi:MAG: magnesium transporter CorA family protein [Candidatus Paceibacterota bacterium]|jgi:magnesium transporter